LLSRGLQNVRDTAIEPIHHGVPGLGQSALYTQFLAQLIELIVAAGFALPAGKQAGYELFVFVCQPLADLDRAGPVQGFGEGLRTGGC
jgi:hypothetical protein